MSPSSFAIPRPSLPTYVAHFVSDDLPALQRKVALAGARQIRTPKRVADVRGTRAYELTLVSNFAVLERLVECFGAWPLYYVNADGKTRVWFPVVRPKHLNGHQLDQMSRAMKENAPAR